MNRRLFRLCAVAVAFAPLHASAAGLGEIVIQSRVGESLRAEIPVTSSAGEAIDTACFTLAPSQNADMPVVSNAKIKLVRDGRGLRLVISGSKAIAEPLFLLSVRANCGVDLQRDYIVMPPPPFMPAEAEATTSLQPQPPRTNSASATKSHREWRAKEGDTLAGIAESMAPDDPLAQQRLLSRMQSLNPEIDPEQSLPDGASVLLPKPRQATTKKPRQPASDAPKKRAAKLSELPQQPRSEKPEVAPQVNTQDRLIVGEAPAELRSGELAAPMRAEMNETEARILKMEQTLSSLRQELEKIDAALAITAEIVVTQEKLKLAKSLQSTANGAIESGALAAPAQASNSTYRSWLELLLSALIGGAAAAGIGHWIGRKKQRQAPEKQTRATPAERSQVFATASAMPDAISMPLKIEEPPPQESRMLAFPVKEVDLLLDNETTKHPVAPPEDIHLKESASLVELAEIMLSFGRVQGAAETLALHIEENSPDNIKHWIALLDLYRRGNMQDDFEAFAPKVRARFNLEIPSWEASTTPISGLKSIDDYSHVAANIIRLWGTRECLQYLNGLVRNNRAKERSGFPLEVVEEIVLLTRILEDAYGLKLPA